MAENQEHSFSEDEIEEFFVDKYVNEYGAFDKRFYEQLKTGTIEKTDDTYHITERGKKLIGIYDVIAGLFNIDRKLIHPQSYTK